jgi:hypothetical protein
MGEDLLENEVNFGFGLDWDLVWVEGRIAGVGVLRRMNF